MAVNGGHAGTKKGPNWGHVNYRRGTREEKLLERDERGNTMRGNRTDRESPRGKSSSKSTSENLRKVPFCDLVFTTSVPLEVFRSSSRRPSRRGDFPLRDSWPCCPSSCCSLILSKTAKPKPPPKRVISQDLREDRERDRESQRERRREGVRRTEGGRERERESESQRVRESESQRVRESESQRVRESESQRVRERERERKKKK